MSSVQTVLGERSREIIEHAQCHEHIWLNKGRSAEINPALCIDDYNKSLEELKSYKAAGGNLIVDAQPLGCGRDAKMLKKLSEKSGVEIIASTGFHKMRFYPGNHWIHTIDTEGFMELMVHEINEGMYGDGDRNFPSETTDIKAGMIKVACDEEGLTPRYLKLFQAAALTSIKTGLPIQCHIEKPGQGDLISYFFIQEGVAPSKIILAHMDRADNDVDELIGVLSKGVFLQFDTIGRYKYHSDKMEISIISRLIHEGFGSQLLIGLDTTRDRLHSYGGEVGLTYILRSFIPDLHQANVEMEQIKRFVRFNPRRALSVN